MTTILKNQTPRLVENALPTIKLMFMLMKIALLFPKDYVVMTKVHVVMTNVKGNFYETTERSKMSM